MRRHPDKRVEIVEPPIEELTRRYSTFSTIRRSCISGCGCFIFVLVLGIAGVKFFIGQGPREIKKTPDDFPQEIPLYDQDNIEEITFVSGEYKKKSTEIAAIFPKIILSPLLMALDEDRDQNSDRFSEVKGFLQIMNSPVADDKNVVKILWSEPAAEADFISSYYKNELRKQNFNVFESEYGENSEKFSFIKNDIEGSFLVESDKDSPNATKRAVLIVNYPN